VLKNHSTGGIIAIALGTQRNKIRKLKQTFQELSSVAFTPRKLHKLPLIGKHVVATIHGSIYKTTALHTALRSALGEQTFFGGLPENKIRHMPKIAVTSTDVSGKTSVTVANYNLSSRTQKESGKTAYNFPRADNPLHEMKCWQAGAATAAAPGFFKPFHHEGLGRTFFDGAFYHNNPARMAHNEYKSIWPDIANLQPDIFVSLGTSQDIKAIASTGRMYRHQYSNHDNFIPRYILTNLPNYQRACG
jgi:patatin-like phospholipase/acyl hydrolase